MEFAKKLKIDRPGVLGSLGYGVAAEKTVPQALMRACEEIENAAQARFTTVRFPLEQDFSLKNAGVCLQGNDIRRHLAGCHAVVLLAVTLGRQVETSIRRAEAASIEQAVWQDAAASMLVEQYADEAEALVRAQVQPEFLTGRFSPGYGDLPLTLQADVVRLLDGPRAIGLSVNTGGLLLPRKSITAVLGVAKTPVSGHLAGCEHCQLYDGCEKRKAGNRCGE